MDIDSPQFLRTQVSFSSSQHLQYCIRASNVLSKYQIPYHLSGNTSYTSKSTVLHYDRNVEALVTAMLSFMSLCV
jgi:hypothetical protein